jgi:hypothetical protein
MWIHENKRVFGDRLIDNIDRDWLDNILIEECKKTFGLEKEEVFNSSRIIFGDYMQGIDVETRIYAQVENLKDFVSKIEVAEKSVDRPYWMGSVDFSGLKIKLIGSLVAISVIELLKDFIELSVDPQQKVGDGTIWRIIIHLTFVVSGVMFALMDAINDNRIAKKKTSLGKKSLGSGI